MKKRRNSRATKSSPLETLWNIYIAIVPAQNKRTLSHTPSALSTCMHNMCRSKSRFEILHLKHLYGCHTRAAPSKGQKSQNYFWKVAELSARIDWIAYSLGALFTLLKIIQWYRWWFSVWNTTNYDSKMDGNKYSFFALDSRSRNRCSHTTQITHELAEKGGKWALANFLSFSLNIFFLHHQ